MTEKNERPLGQLFTEVYGDKGDPKGDDPRFRVQVSALVDQVLYSYSMQSKLAGVIRLRLGLEIPTGYECYLFDKWVKSVALDDLFNVITLIAIFLRNTRDQEKWLKGIGNALAQRNLNYEIDNRGGIHPLVDTVFQHAKRLTLAGLVGAEFAAAHEELEKAYDFLTQRDDPDTKMAVVNIFLAAENVFKLVFDTNASLDEAIARRNIQALIQKLYASKDGATLRSAASTAESFAKWVNACHPYRHGHSEVETIAPPQELAITLVTTGSDFIRWLVELRRICRQCTKDEKVTH